MSISILICDDSSFARKQITRALPQDIDAKLSFASDGKQALDIIRQGDAELTFLDLNMPIMDGYEVLAQIRAHDLNTMVIVISGDIQPEAYKRVKELGALEFIKKPVHPDTLIEVCKKFGLFDGHQITPSSTKKSPPVTPDPKLDTDPWDCYKEIANIAMGQAASLLATLLGSFIQMPIPTIRSLRPTELYNMLQKLNLAKETIIVCQGFLGREIAGEALLVFSGANTSHIAEMLQQETDLTDSARAELMMDLGSVLTGAFLKSIAEQLDIEFGLSNPLVYKSGNISKSLCQASPTWEQTLAMELRCVLGPKKVRCTLLLLFTEDSIAPLNKYVNVLTG